MGRKFKIRKSSVGSQTHAESNEKKATLLGPEAPVSHTNRYANKKSRGAAFESLKRGAVPVLDIGLLP